MKKIIMTIITTVAVMTAIYGGLMIKQLEYHKAQLTEVSDKYESLLDEANAAYAEVDENMNQLESQVYNMMSGDDYEVKVHVDGKLHTYYGEKDGIFMHKSHTVMY